MVTINLLPGRQVKEHHENSSIKKIMGFAVLASIIFYCCSHLGLQYQLQQIQRQSVILEQDKKQYAVMRQTDTVSAAGCQVSVEIKQLQLQLVNLLHNMSAQISPQVCFIEMHRQQAVMSWQGRAHSVLDLTNFLLQWRAAGLFDEIKVSHIQQQRNHFVTFRLRGEFRDSAMLYG
ncbi:MAG TPA: hypothetical protein VHZ76_04845 [Gammaproteobacteria bacterium]|nr:hypothetical protein [Gammaproteobacteria bacterium]